MDLPGGALFRKPGWLSSSFQSVGIIPRIVSQLHEDSVPTTDIEQSLPICFRQDTSQETELVMSHSPLAVKPLQLRKRTPLLPPVALGIEVSQSVTNIVRILKKQSTTRAVVERKRLLFGRLEPVTQFKIEISRGMLADWTSSWMPP
jgi:hypothetical protein